MQAPNESEIIRVIFLLADTQSWLNGLVQQAIQTLHPPAGKLLNAKNYRLSVTALAHILERHYHNTLRHPGTGKFTIPVATILDYLKEAAALIPQPIPGCNNFSRTLDIHQHIGFNRLGEPSTQITIITDHSAAIITAFPG